MSLWKLNSLRHIGFYNTQLKVDHIDTDYCLRAALNKFELMLNPTVTFVHSIGKRRKYRLLGMTLQSGGHSPQRRELIARNSILLGRHYLIRYPSFAVLSLIRISYEILGIMLVENNRSRKLFAVIKGAVTGLVTRYA
jgi:rhamnosyltransferase